MNGSASEAERASAASARSDDGDPPGKSAGTEPSQANEPASESSPADEAASTAPKLAAPASLAPPPRAQPILADTATTSPVADQRQAGSAAQAAPAQPADLVPAAFNGVRPGETSEEQLLAAWGDPLETHATLGQTRHVYRIRPFSRVEATVAEGQVASLAIHLGAAIESQVVARQLKLDLDSAATVRDESGQPLGLVFPERGVLFSYAPKPGQPRVMLVALDPIDAQPFLVRAEERLRGQPSAALADLERALALDPNYAHAWWLQARLLLEHDRAAEALAAANEALRLEPAAPQYRLTRAAAQAATGDHAAALAETDAVRAAPRLEPLIRGQALRQRGDLTADGPRRDVQQALSWHTQAIKVVDPLGLDERPEVRRAAKELLLELHLAVANDVAWGRYRDKAKVVPKWLERAAAFAEDLEQSEGVDLPLRLRVARGALAAAAGLQGKLNTARWLARGQEQGEALVAEASDPALQAQLRWQLALLSYDALQVEHARGNVAEADRHGKKIVAALEALQAPWRPEACDYLLGRTYFRLGAVQAVHQNEHSAAVAWYERARPLLARPAKGLALADTAPRGEDFVSMAVSYWEVGQRELAVELTRQGVEQLQQGTRDRQVEPAALAVPYGNLANMLEELGQADESRRYAELAAGSRESKMR